MGGITNAWNLCGRDTTTELKLQKTGHVVLLLATPTFQTVAVNAMVALGSTSKTTQKGI